MFSSTHTTGRESLILPCQGERQGVPRGCRKSPIRVFLGRIRCGYAGQTMTARRPLARVYVRRRWGAVITFVVVGTVVATLLVASNRGNDAKDERKTVSVDALVRLGPSTSRVSVVVIGGRRYPLERAGDERHAARVALLSGTATADTSQERRARIDVTPNAAGLVTAEDATGRVVGTSLVWKLPGVSVLPVEVTCLSTAVAQTLIRPGLVTADPVEADILMTVAREGPRARPVAERLSMLLCAHAPTDPDYLQHPTAQETAAFDDLAAAVRDDLATLAEGLPDARTAYPQARDAAALLPRSGRLHQSGQPAATPPKRGAESETVSVLDRQADPTPSCVPVPRVEPRASLPVDLCVTTRTDGNGEVRAENHGGAWTFVFRGTDMPSQPPALLVPPETAKIPKVSELAVSLVVDLAKLAGCRVPFLKRHIDACQKSFWERSELVDLVDIVETGEQTVTLAHASPATSWYGISAGTEQGTTIAFPLPPGDVTVRVVRAAAGVFTLFTQVIKPSVSLLLDVQPAHVGLKAFQNDRLLVTIGTNLLDEVFALQNAQGPRAQVAALGEVFTGLLSDPENLIALLLRSGFDAGSIDRKVLTALAKKMPWNMPVEILDAGSAALSLLLSLQRYLQAGGQPSFASWQNPTPTETPKPSVPGPATVPRSGGLFDLPVTDLSTASGAEPCRPAPKPVPSPIPQDAQCLWIIAADLDGNRLPDRLALWSKGESQSAVAQLDSGRIPAAEPPRRPAVFLWRPGGSPRIYAIGDVVGDTGEEVQLDSYSGANAISVTIVSLTQRGTLALTQSDDGERTDLTVGGSANRQSAMECATPADGGRERLLVLYTDTTGPADIVKWSRTAYAWRNGRLVPVAEWGGVNRSESRSPIQSCRAGPYRVPARVRQAESAQEAAALLLEAANRGDREAARFYTGGWLGDTYDNTPVTTSGLLDPYPTLIERHPPNLGIRLSAYARTPPVCTAPTAPGNRALSTRSTCTVTPSGGSIPAIKLVVWRDDRTDWWFVEYLPT
ncbi:hypothetical protein [Embleya sp. NPDC001921]